MNHIECPYCELPMELNHDDGYEEDYLYQKECPNCNKNFVYDITINVNYHAHKADCLNTGKHNYKRTITFPPEAARLRCSECGEEIPIPKDPLTIEIEAFIQKINSQFDKVHIVNCLYFDIKDGNKVRTIEVYKRLNKSIYFYYKGYIIITMKKLSSYAKENDITYMTAYRMAKSGKIQTKILPTGLILVVPDKIIKKEHIVTYARVSSSENKDNLDKQSERLINYCNAKGWKVDRIVKEIGSGLNDNRKQLEQILKEGKITRLIVEHQDRLTRFGLNYIKILCFHIGCELEIINSPQNEKEDLIQDFISIITSFCARIYGQRRSKRQTEKLIKELEDDKKDNN